MTGLEGNIDGSIITGWTVVKSASSLLFNIIRFDGSLDALYPILFLIRIDMYELIYKNKYELYLFIKYKL